ncbi:hypothetical protein RIF29_28326 [Crotalaria pallida]|uniref:Uncharacterized protein n=1 Tax=Crotalaria pallida TaxID=3830 RepID=A0AAN9HZL9_CROPI
MNEMEDDDDPWLGLDKLYHFLFCFSLTLLFHPLLSSLSPFSLLRRHSLLFASLSSLLAGAAKEAADHLGFFHSSAASSRDFLADLLGVLVAASALSSLSRLRIRFRRSSSNSVTTTTPTPHFKTGLELV